MTIINRILSMLQIVLKRMTTQPWLVAAKVLGLFVGMMMMLAIPLYADAVNYKLFSETTLDTPDRPGFPPFSIFTHYVGAWNGAVDYETIEAIDSYIWDGEYAEQVKLPVKLQAKNIRTNNFQLLTNSAAGADGANQVKYAALNMISNFQEHVTLLDGSFDGWEEGLINGRVPIMIHEKTAQETGINVGEEYIFLVRWRDEENERQRQEIPLVISGIYTQTEPTDDFWYFGSTKTLNDRLIVSEYNYAHTIADSLPNEVYSVSWFQEYDSDNIHFDQTQGIRTRIYTAILESQQLLNGTETPVSPLDSLKLYDEESRTLTLYLFIICAPIVILILFFIGMVSKIEVDSRLNEIAILRSRGATRGQIVFIEGVEALVLGLLSALLAIPAAIGITQIIARTRSFLDFKLIGETLRVQVNNPMWITAAVMVGVAILTQVIPTITASKHTVQSYKRQQARLIQKTWWQRFYLDFALLGLVIFGMYLIHDLGESGFYTTIGENSIVYSLVYLLPILLAMAVSLLFLRLMPLILAVLSWVVGKTKNINFLMAVRTLHRMPNAYQMPLMLLVITVNIAVFTTTLAATVDQHLYDQLYYQIGSEMRFVDYGESQVYQSSDTASSAQTWTFLPVEYYLQMPGAAAVSRLGEYSMRPGFENAATGTFFGIDRVGFSQAAYWREDFSEDTLGELMNQLALYSDGVLVSRSMADAYSIGYGDLVPVNILVYGEAIPVEMIVVGVFDYFPTWYPEEDGDLMVGNLDYIFNIGAGPYPYSVLLQTQSNFDSLLTAEAIKSESNITWLDGGRAGGILETHQQEPTRQGFFGMLTISFLITSLLSVLGFFLYAVFSLRRRLIELGVLRAIGLSTKQMAATLAWEFISLIFSGALVGTLTGLFSSRFFVPYMQIGTDQLSQVPPYYINIAWNQIYQIYGLLTVLFLLLVFALVAFLRRIKVFEAIKLGETV